MGIPDEAGSGRAVDEGLGRLPPSSPSGRHQSQKQFTTRPHPHDAHIATGSTTNDSFASLLGRERRQRTSSSAGHHTTDTFVSYLRKRSPTRHTSSQSSPTQSLRSFFTPADTPTHFASRNHKGTPRKSKSSPHISNPVSTSPTYLVDMQPRRGNSSDNDDEASMIYTSWRGSSGNLRANGGAHPRARIYGNSSSGALRSRETPNPICTAPGAACAGETETEMDEPPRQLPTARIVPSSGPLIPPNTLEQKLTPWLFELSRLLSIVPAVIGTIYNLYQLLYPPTSLINGRGPPERIDFFVSALWSILTGYQCLCLTTGLLTRWRLYYPPLSTLIRLLALQGICWPATHLTLTILEHEKRPVITWAVIGTTTCCSRSIQIWVTSNLWWERRDSKEVKGGEESKRAYSRRWGGKWGGRRWDWKEVGVKCVLPAGLVYFVMAWAEQLRREWSTC